MSEKNINLIVINKDYCPQNHKCSMVNLCHKGAISQLNQNSIPEINLELCDDCGDCYAMCRAFERV